MTVERWLTTDYPQIVEQARRVHGEIHWGDETGIQHPCHHGRGYAPYGEPPAPPQDDLDRDEAGHGPLYGV